MKIKRFLEKDARTAMSRARAELGAEAVILSNKSVGGRVELVAELDEELERILTRLRPL